MSATVVLNLRGFKLSTSVPVSDLQQETWALRHEDNSDECSQRREETHKNKQPPAVNLELRADGKAPAWKMVQ